MGFSFMHSNGVPIDTYALCSSLNGCSFVQNVVYGKQIHAFVGKSGWLCSVFVGSAIVDMYAKNSLIYDAVEVFDEMPMKNTVCANALLAGYGEARMWVEGLELLRKMQGLDLKYDQFTLSASLRACTGLSAIALGKQVHAYILRTVYDITSDVHLQSTLVEMYGKNGMVEKAWNVFKFAGLGRQEDGKRDIIMWTSMLSVYGRNGCYKRVIELYNQMLMEGIKPDRVAFVTVISACGHTGEVNLGVQYFDSMQSDFGLEPGQEHYSCLADLLCRAGELEKAWKLVNDIKSRDYNVSLWGALLRACLEQGNIKLGNLAARRALELDPQNTGILVMLSNLYAGFGLWNEIEHLRESVRKEGLYKDVACNKANNETVITILARLEDDVKTTKDHCQQRLYPRRGTDGLLVKAILYRFKLLRAFSALTEVFPSNIHKFHFTD
ncbi:pentatricopeptide repeat-containing protein At5g04780, mitochondrial [Cucumis sativus]|uniref:pentatricopeptide repeat-containing protein At5g04780, mitochondrial n=1 Tax=Cucumis sativus TaxID=3659 RepID=UPI0012F48998|nr:pentatricopeptide repeat-containing protein At5g04780, mitochondrial [Cucumis sativus]